MSRLADLAQLRACLEGRPLDPTDWSAAVRIANEGLLTPQLHQVLAGARLTERMPGPLAEFVRLVHDLNLERNRRLADQLAEALGALNGAGIVPILLKGAALWATLPDEPLARARMMSDLDLLVAPPEVPRALYALEQAGFPVLARYEGLDVHVVAELGRPQDVGCIDLHQRPPGPLGVVTAAGYADGCFDVSWRGARARAPDFTLQILCLVLHDQFHDGGYWRGGFDLRHLLDIALISRAGRVDWDRLNRLSPAGLPRTALQTELIAASRLTNAAIPAALMGGRWAMMQHARHLAQFAWPALSPGMALAAAVSEWRALASHRSGDRRTRRRLLGQDARSTWSRLVVRLQRVRHILSTMPGKL